MTSQSNPSTEGSARPTPFQLVIVRNPFDRTDKRVIQRALEDAPTLEALVGEYIPAGVEMDVSINGELILPEEWRSRSLVAHDQVVMIPAIGDFGEGGNPLAMLAMIAVTAMAPWAASTMLGFSSVAAAWAAPGLAMAFATAGISMLGSMVVGSLFAPTKPSLPSQALGSFDNSPSYGWAPQTLQTPGAPIARAHGTVKLRGNIIAGYIESSGDSGTVQIAHVLIDLGHGPYKEIREIKINDQYLSAYTGVKTTVRLGYLDQDPIPGFEDTRVTHSYNTKVVGSGPAITKTTVGTAFGALEVVLTAPAGIYAINDLGKPVAFSQQLSIEISADGGSTWKFIRGTATDISIPVVPAGGQWEQGFWQDNEGNIGGQYQSSLVWYPAAVGSTVRGDHTDGDPAGPSGDYWSTWWQWFDEDHNVATTVANYINLIGSSPKPIRSTFRIDGLTVGATYQVRVTNLGADLSANSRYGATVYFAELNEVILDDFTYPRSVLVGIDALNTEQLNGQLNFSCIADAALVWVYRDGGWHYEHSRSPAWVTWDILTQPVSADTAATDYTLGGDVLRFDGITPSRNILQTFINWATFCTVMVPDGNGGTEERCLWDAVFDSETDLWSAALEVAASARATIAIMGTSFAAVYDDEKTEPAQIFTMGNKLQFSERFLPMEGRASVIEVTFPNAALDYQRDVIEIVNTNLAAQWGVATPKRAAMRGVTRASQNAREATFMLGRNEHLQRTGELFADINSLSCTLGDRVDVQEDVTFWGEGGRAVSGTTTSVVLDHPITFATGDPHEIKVHLSNAASDAIETRAITMPGGAYPQTVSSITCAAFSYAVNQYDVWAIGPVGEATKPLIITGVKRDSEQRARLSWIEYNSTLYGLDAGLKAQPTPNISASVGFSRILLDNPSPGTGETVPNLPTERLVRYADGPIETMVDLRWWFEDRSKVSKTIVKWRELHGYDWHYDESLTDRITVGPVLAGSMDWGDGIVEPAEYVFILFSVNYLGQVQAFDRSQYWDYVPIGKTAPPADVTNFVVTEQADGKRVFTWDAVADVDLDHYEIRYSATNTAWASQTLKVTPTEGWPTNVFTDRTLAAGTYYFRIKAIDTSGNESLNATNATVTPKTLSLAPTGPILNVNITVDGAGQLAGSGTPTAYVDNTKVSSAGPLGSGGQRVEHSPAGSSAEGESRWYDSANVLVASVGVQIVAGDDVIGLFGTIAAGNNRIGVHGRSYGNTGVIAESVTSYGLTATSPAGAIYASTSSNVNSTIVASSTGSIGAVFASSYSGSGYGVEAVGNATKAALRLSPQSGTPANTSEGQVSYDSADHKMKYRSNAAWVTVQDASLAVPYSGATGNVDLNAKTLTNVSALGVTGAGTFGGDITSTAGNNASADWLVSQSGWVNGSTKNILWKDSVATLARIGADYSTGTSLVTLRFGSLYHAGYEAGDTLTMSHGIVTVNGTANASGMITAHTGSAGTAFYAPVPIAINQYQEAKFTAESSGSYGASFRGGLDGAGSAYGSLVAHNGGTATTALSFDGVGAVSIPVSLSVTGTATLGVVNASGQISGTSADVGGVIGATAQIVTVNSNGAVGDFSGVRFNYYNSAGTGGKFGYIGLVMTSTSTNGVADMVFGVKASTATNTISEYMRLSAAGLTVDGSIVGVDATATRFGQSNAVAGVNYGITARNTSASAAAKNGIAIGNDVTTAGLTLVLNSSAFTAENNYARLTNQLNGPLLLGSNGADIVSIVSTGQAVSGTGIFTAANTALTGGTGILTVASNSAFGADVGGSIVFNGVYTGSSQTNFGGIKGAKLNATDGNVAGYLGFYTRADGAVPAEYMRLTSVALTTPAQPAFLAYLSANVNNITGADTVATIVNDTEVFDQGGNHNNGNGKFTAPVTGRYRFSVAAYMAEVGGADYVQLFLYTSNRNYLLANIWFPPNSEAGLNGGTLVDLDAGDEAYARIQVGSLAGNTSDLVGAGSTLNTYFSGELVA